MHPHPLSGCCRARSGVAARAFTPSAPSYIETLVDGSRARLCGAREKRAPQPLRVRRSDASQDTVAAATLQCAWQSPSHLPVSYRTRRCSDGIPFAVPPSSYGVSSGRSALQRVAPSHHRPSQYQPPQPPLPRWFRSALQRHRLIVILRIISLLTRPSRWISKYGGLQPERPPAR